MGLMGEFSEPIIRNMKKQEIRCSIMYTKYISVIRL